MRTHIICIALMCATLSCAKQEETAKTSTTKEVEKKHSPEKLLSAAKAHMDKGNWEKAKILLNEIKYGAPESEQAKEATPLLKKANEKIKAAKEAEKKRALSKMRVEKDNVEGITFYSDRSSPNFVNTTAFYAYIGTRGDKPWLQLKIQYASDDWLFIESYTVKTDRRSFEITEKSYGEIKKDHSGGKIWEWLDRHVGKHEYQMMEAVSNSKSATIRYRGKDYVKDKAITESQKTAFKNVLEAYKALGGEEIR